MDWIENLKVGDDVIQTVRLGTTRVAQVTAITPTLVKTSSGASFTRATGRQRGADRWACAHLLEATPEAVKRVSAANAASFLRAVRWEKLPADSVLSLATQVRALLPKAESA